MYKGKIVYLVKPNDIEIDRARKYAIPKVLRHIHAYHPEHLKLVEFNDSNNTLANKTIRQKLLEKQARICPVCLGRIDLYTPINSHRAVIHHKTPISEGGEPKKINNLELLHKECHFERHRQENKAD